MEGQNFAKKCKRGDKGEESVFGGLYQFCQNILKLMSQKFAETFAACHQLANF